MALTSRRTRRQNRPCPSEAQRTNSARGTPLLQRVWDLVITPPPFNFVARENLLTSAGPLALFPKDLTTPLYRYDQQQPQP